MARFFIIFLLLLPLVVLSKQYTISGFVVNNNTREALVSAYITDSLGRQLAITNQSGCFGFSFPEGQVKLVARYVGYKNEFHSFNLNKDTLINFYLIEKEEVIDEVVITGEVPIHEQTLMGKTVFPMSKILAVPSFVGVPDLMKAITVIPGINAGNDGRSNIFVRGGDRGQNLILLDGAKLYNTSHFGGFISLFNADLIKQVEVYKSGFPPRYGGRASSVIDITTRDGNREEVHGKFNLGLLSSGFSLEGPIGEKLSFVTGIRTTYYDLFTIKKRIEYKYKSDINYLGYTFYDANAKLTFHASDKHRIFINFFSGSDFNKNCDKTETSSMNSENFTKYVVNNLCLSVGNRLTLNAKAMWHNLFTFSNHGNSLNSKYHQIYKGLTTIENYNSETLIKEFNLQSRFEYFGFKGNVIKSGFEYSYYQFVPGISHTYSENYTSGSKTDTVQGYLTPILSHETSFYFEDDIAIGKQIFLNIGMRGVFFRSRSTNYLKAEPRFSIRAQLGKNLSTKANYTIMNQFNHVVVSTFNIYEKEVWIASTKNIPPQQAQQFSFGIFGTAPVINMEFSAETYYKTMNNLLEYKAPTSGDIAITDLEAMVVKGGKGEAYGFEFQSKYSAKRFSVDASYVLSWNYRQFDEINNGAWYPFLFDRRHQFSFLTSLILGKHYSLNTNFQFSTGSPCTIPDSYVSTRSDTYYEYYTFSEINNYRMPDYHRLDLALVKREKIKKGRIQQFSLNIYNVFARQNPIRIYFEKGKVFQTSLFTIIPTISYSLEF